MNDPTLILARRTHRRALGSENAIAFIELVKELNTYE
jgi:hypothetical protein